jgi:uncharacterized protein
MTNLQSNSQLDSTFSDNKKVAYFVTDKHLHLIILPTEQCNFRCVYCYEDFSIGRMSNEIISAVKALIKKRSENLRTLHISWFGGEPLVAKNIVLDICQYALSLTDRYPNLHYSSSITTNAYLLDLTTVTALAHVGVKDYQISLDGPQEIHDRSRLRADGKGTFAKIWNNLLAIRDSNLPVRVNLRLHFTADNLQFLDPLVADLRKEFIHDSRFEYSFMAIRHHGGSNDSSINVLTGKEEFNAIKSLEGKLFSGAERSSFDNNEITTHHEVCYASKANSLLIRANGTIGKCTVALSDERNNIGTLQPDGTLKLIPGRFAPWVRGIETLDPSTLGCPLVGLPTSEDILASLKEKTLVAQI